MDETNTHAQVTCDLGMGIGRASLVGNARSPSVTVTNDVLPNKASSSPRANFIGTSRCIPLGAPTGCFQPRPGRQLQRYVAPSAALFDGRYHLDLFDEPFAAG